MSDLEMLKVRRDVYYPGVTERESHIIGDLDRAISLVEGVQEAFNMMMDERVEVSDGRLTRERDEARAAVLRLREHIKNSWTTDGYVPLDPEAVLADTESYEQYR